MCGWDITIEKNKENSTWENLFPREGLKQLERLRLEESAFWDEVGDSHVIDNNSGGVRKKFRLTTKINIGLNMFLIPIIIPIFHFSL